MNVPIPTPIYRLMHRDSLVVCLKRAAMHAPNHTPPDGLIYKNIHNTSVQTARSAKQVPCGPRGVIHDYVSFYLGPRSPMLYQLHTGWVPGYNEGQQPLVYVVTSAQSVASRHAYVFSDGHGVAAFTNWFDSLDDLGKVDWSTVYATRWKDTNDDLDRQRRKQAEFLVHKSCEWAIVERLAVISNEAKTSVQTTLDGFPEALRRPVDVMADWYY